MNRLIGLLWYKETDKFPEADLERALHRFPQRRDLRGLKPGQVHLNPRQAVNLGDVLRGIEVVTNAYIGLNHLWLTGVTDETFVEEIIEFDDEEAEMQEKEVASVL